MYCADYKDFYRKAVRGAVSWDDADPVLAGFVWLHLECSFDPSWVEAFFYSMSLDLDKKNYNTLEETIEYMYGSAEVIGLFMAKIMNLPDAALSGARMLGRSMQYINFIRDIKEDNTFGRRYIPLSDAPFKNLQEEETRKYPDDFEKFIRRELRRFLEWQEEANASFMYLPRRFRVAVGTASDMYLWTAEQLYRNPWRVYRGSLKPSKSHIILRAIVNSFTGAAPHRTRYT